VGWAVYFDTEFSQSLQDCGEVIGIPRLDQAKFHANQPSLNGLVPTVNVACATCGDHVLLIMTAAGRFRGEVFSRDGSGILPPGFVHLNIAPEAPASLPGLSGLAGPTGLWGASHGITCWR